MSTIQQAHKALSEVDDFGKHRDTSRLLRAFQSLKQLGAQAMCEGDITACKAIAHIIETLHHHGLDVDNRELQPQFSELYIAEFKPTIFIVSHMCDAPLHLHQQTVDVAIEHDRLAINGEVISLAKNMAKSGHFAPLSRFLEAKFNRMKKEGFDPESEECSAITNLLHRCAVHIEWESDNTKPLLKTVVKHADFIGTLVEQCSSSDQCLWDEIINPGMLRAVQSEDSHNLLETLFHEYAYSNAEEDVFAELVGAGMQLDIQRIEDYLNRWYDAPQGQYPYSAIHLHLCSHGRIPMLVDFSMFGGQPVGVFLNRCLRKWGKDHCEIAVQLAHAFLDHNPDGSGLYVKPLPRQLLDRSERLREESLGSDLGL